MQLSLASVKNGVFRFMFSHHIVPYTLLKLRRFCYPKAINEIAELQEQKLCKTLNRLNYSRHVGLQNMFMYVGYSPNFQGRLVSSSP
jgi:hypothetical protein